MAAPASPYADLLAHAQALVPPFSSDPDPRWGSVRVALARAHRSGLPHDAEAALGLTSAQLHGRAQSLLQNPPANDLWDPDIKGLLEIVTPSTIKAELEALRASYEIVHQSAKGNPAWEVHYAEFQQFYDKNKDPGWLTSSFSTVRTIRQRARRLEEWKDKLRSEGVRVQEPAKQDPSGGSGSSSSLLPAATALAVLALGGILLLKR